MKKAIFTASLLLIAAACAKQTVTIPTIYDYSHKLAVGNQLLMVEIVQSPEKMATGLSGRENMGSNEGMLFDFAGQAPSNLYFWMKDMKFNLDLIWINKNKIIGITANVPVPVNCESLTVKCSLPAYFPPSQVDMVLEVNAGWAQGNNVKVGDEVIFFDKN